MAAERRKCADLQAQVDAKVPSPDDGIDDQIMVKQLSMTARVKDLEAQLAVAESDRDSAISRAISAERVLEERQEKMARGNSREFENVPLLDAEDGDSNASLKARVRQLESQLARSEGSSAALQDAAARAAERLHAQAMKERELEQQLADASGGGQQMLRRAFEGMGAVNQIFAGQVSRCLRGRPDEPDSPLPRV